MQSIERPNPVNWSETFVMVSAYRERLKRTDGFHRFGFELIFCQRDSERRILTNIGKATARAVPNQRLYLANSSCFLTDYFVN